MPKPSLIGEPTISNTTIATMKAKQARKLYLETGTKSCRKPSMLPVVLCTTPSVIGVKTSLGIGPSQFPIPGACQAMYSTSGMLEMPDVPVTDQVVGTANCPAFIARL